MSDYKYEFDRSKCWYLGNCKKEETPECCHACLRYMEMHYLMNNSGIPPSKQKPILLTPSKVDLESFLFLKSIKEDIVNFVNNGESLYIYSTNFGNGKTSWALKLLHNYFNEVWLGNSFRCRGMFIHVPTFLTKIKEGISCKDEQFDLMKKRLKEVDLVVWDDIASTSLGDFDHTNLLTYIDIRKLSELSNIYTGNLEQGQLVKALGNRLSSRVWNDSSRVEFIGADRRSSRR